MTVPSVSIVGWVESARPTRSAAELALVQRVTAWASRTRPTLRLQLGSGQ
jgi:hypothetical protein